MRVVDQIHLEPSAAEVGRFNQWLDERLAASAIEASLGFDTKLCLNEILANLIAYGLRDTVDPSILIEIELLPGRASALVSDNGAYFDIRTYEPPRGRDLMTCEPGGFGLALVKERVTNLEYRHSAGLNRLSFTCELSPPVPGSALPRP
ncbi:MAG: ATP-binding protein [Hyphomicrobium sp.]|nr:ATP-binding protein [Hyphomicrobium sp.]